LERAVRAARRRPLTAASLEDAALAYLGNYASSSANLRRVLLRRVKRAAEGGAEEAEAAKIIDALIARFLASGLLDDRAHAGQAAASLHRRGVPAAGIRYRLAQKGLARELIDAALGALAAEGGSELAAACALARRRRLGPFRPQGERAAQHRRDLGILARAGFGFAVARRVLAARDGDALEREVREEGSG
jgi:regulatory protein